MAGLLYGFGPFALSFLGFHPVAGLTFATTPCLLLPAVYWHRGQQPTLARFAVRAALCVLPFAFIIGFFWMFSQHWAGPIFLLPGKTLLTGYDFIGLALPLSMTGRPVVIGLYHSGILAALMGAFVYLSAQRVTVLIPPVIGLALAFLDPVFRVSPVIWAALPMVFLAILAGLGFQALLWAGKSDAKWVLACMLTGLVLAGISLALYLPHKTDMYQYPALFYTVAAVGLGTILLLLYIGWRWLLLRWLILVGIVAADSFLTARWLIDKLF